MRELKTRPDRLIHALKMRGKKQIDLSKHAGISKGTVSNWINNPEILPHGDNLFKLCLPENPTKHKKLPFVGFVPFLELF